MGSSLIVMNWAPSQGKGDLLSVEVQLGLVAGNVRSVSF